ncbi:extracellular solute-binding protein [Bradyrhizobium sp. NL2]|uniref:extracellular solute-binding protein n=1 Tax=Bradyrhizobium sp. NL2 TaxID=3082951 RepID=UPI00315C7454
MRSPLRQAFVFILLLLGSIGQSTGVRATEMEQDCAAKASALPPVQPTVLRVALYPFVPDRLALFEKIEAIFECENPGVNVVLISTPNATDNYYDDDDEKKKGIQFVDADVYEIDTILLSDFVNLGKIAPIELPFDDLAPETVKAVTRNSNIYGVPHWLCGNFLFYRKSDTATANVVTWEDLVDTLGKHHGTLLIDFKGHSTLGEWYITALSAMIGMDAAQRQILNKQPVDPSAIAHLQKILSACAVGYCRSQALHNNTGFYARAFVRGQARAYIGYSETIYYGLRDAADNCLPTSGCMAEDDIAVRALPRFGANKAETGVGWVDALAIDAKLNGAKKDLAQQFIRRVVSEDIYIAMLGPEWPYRSRYLLPARTSVRIPDAPLYAQLFKAHADRGTGTAPRLNRALRDIAQTVNCALTMDRNDQDNAACSKN